jgi:dihydrofolate reductase
MNNKELFSVIAATDSQWGIGKGGRIPWHHPEDFKWFKTMTMGTTCYMGRVTYLELAQMREGQKELLPGRKCIVISSGQIDDKRVTVCNNINNYLDYATDSNFFIGGTSIFKFGLQVSDHAYITNIPGDHGCDVRFPVTALEKSFSINKEVDLGTLKVSVYTRDIT